MRSFIKSHRRNESSTSDDHTFSSNGKTDVHLPPVSNAYSSKTPMPSPNIRSNSQFTPPQAVSSSASISSPKKLLTPIKNLFSSSNHNNSKSTATTPTSSDSLNNVIYGLSKESNSSKTRLRHISPKHSHSRASISNLSDLQKSANRNSGTGSLDHPSKPNPHLWASESSPEKIQKQYPVIEDGGPSTFKLGPAPIFKSSNSYPSLVAYQQIHSLPPTNSQSHTSLSSFHSAVSSQHKLPTSGVVTPVVMEKVEGNDSSNSLEVSEHKFETKQVSFYSSPINDIASSSDAKIDSTTTDTDHNIDPLRSDDSDDGEDISETSSQFSFVKDRKGGRNTSVKYYKTKQAKQPVEEALQSNTFNEHDLGYEVDEFSDYDFENNGMDIYDDDDGDDVQYNNAFDDDDGDDVRFNNALDDDEVNANSTFQQEDINSISQSVSSDNHRNNDEESSKYDINEDEHPFDHEDEYKRDITLENDFEDGGDNKAFYSQDESHPVNDIDNLEVEDNDTNEDYGVKDSANKSFSALSSISRKKAQVPFEQFHFNGDIEDHVEHLGIATSIASSTGSVIENVGQTGYSMSNEDLANAFRQLALLGMKRENSPLQIGEKSEPQDTDLENDILENYLDVSKSPSLDISNVPDSRKTPELTSLDDLQLFDLTSPIINGLTFGQNLNQRRSNRANIQNKVSVTEVEEVRPDLHKYESFHTLNGDLTSQSERQSENPEEEVSTEVEDKDSEVVGLGISKDIQASETSETNATDESIGSQMVHNPRSSINEMMNLLGNLESSMADKTSVNGTDVNSTNVRNPSNKQELRRSSIVGMMSLLSDLEKTQAESESKEESSEKKERAKKNRKSIAEMMSTLSALESANSESNEISTRRDSITNMMSTLAKLDLSNIENTIDGNVEQVPSINIESADSKRVPFVRKLETNSDLQKRYSWFNDDEKISFASKNASAPAKGSSLKIEIDGPISPEVNLHSEDYNRPLTQDLLDEINQLPEDFDFQEHEYRSRLSSPVSENSFFRSNSYNKKPVKAIMESKYSSNKIETTNKTVTFYRNNSSGPSLDLSRSRSVSRAPSTRSINSFTSVNEEPEEYEEIEVEDTYKNPTTFTSPPQFSFKLSTNYSKSNESFPKAPNNLSTITEADSPIIK
ncbi:hypothetical protein PICST_67542 [Scheffersomyces stipitis CBS 6054]|uniref:Uncharacterized protein n=1 Tax=Scheffersomyces stipitis (strain ATCC 58785 / CBS 6054 / NBRC 10063 / NRRL Y-11545) TaxID=322104 RepID=A3LTF3_PICST|nr:hypothetical protein PICST_67542 [Scheffersomyces stipitis CBS 6054]ABN66395.2 hypothetical protein PICST_67542 [Scheffersomyces stipitis CBS 6054]KAG2733229.1 hypothetical protein G9P44_004219 [Scheffersomyces stipitis]